MIRNGKDKTVETRENMRGGSGSVSIAHLWKRDEMNAGCCRMAAEITIPPGCGIGFHRHEEEEEIFYIISGVADFDDDGRRVRLAPGDTTLTTAGGGHAIANAGEEDLVVLAVINRFHS